MTIIEIYQSDIQFFKSQRDDLQKRLNDIDLISYDFGDANLSMIQKNKDRESWGKSIEYCNEKIFNFEKEIDKLNQY